jgi:acyl-CoA synthetase (AMP-forming)/AMP-acid ligase II
MEHDLGSLASRRARNSPTLAALIEGETGLSIDCAEFEQRAARAANALAGLGITAGDRVGLLLPNGPEIFEAYMGIAKLGAIAVPLNWRLVAGDAAERIGSAGRASLTLDLRIVDSDGRDCLPDEPGEVWLRGPSLMRGYWGLDEASAETLQGGWLHTGDIAVRDADGFVTLRDRLKDMIISGGENVYPAEVEQLLREHPAVSDVAVIGQPSARWGESPFAVVVAADPKLSVASVLGFCDGRLARFKQPRGAALIDELPRNPSGKVLKNRLRERFPGPAPE